MQGRERYLFFYGTPADPSTGRTFIRPPLRHRSDGLILIEPSVIADFRMRIFNADGSEAMMLNSGIAAASMFTRRAARIRRPMIETRAGIRSLQQRYPPARSKASR